jgi:heat-inducible transcriptional repressor
VDQLLPSPGAAALQLDRELAGISLQWAALDDLLQHLARRLADLTGLLSLISRPRQPRHHLEEVRLVVSSDRLLVFLVQGAALTTSLNLRLPAGSADQMPLLERWANDQLRSQPAGRICWERLPAQLGASGGLLRQALESHAQLGRLGDGDAVVAAGLGGLLAQPEFSRTSSLLPLVQLVEKGPQQVLAPSGLEGTLGGIWIGSEHPHSALGQCAVVQAAYDTADGSRGHVALVGPMRMAYSTARSAVQSVASILQRLLS